MILARSQEREVDAAGVSLTFDGSTVRLVALLLPWRRGQAVSGRHSLDDLGVGLVADFHRRLPDPT